MRLTELAKGGGCGCKLPPDLLRGLLRKAAADDGAPPADLLVDATTADDAAVWRLADDIALIATADFFSPIVDDSRHFGQIAAANALSDVYAMGGEPLFALALVAMPKDILSPATIADILAGGKEACRRAGVVVAGGHSIDAQEPLYGLAVVGRAHPDRLLTNAGAQDGDILMLGKPLGVGVLSAALRRGLLTGAEYGGLLAAMTQLNRAGPALARLDGAHALTDVTGFGLLGHLAEICRASNCAATVNFSALPLLPAAARHAKNGVVTGASDRNWRSVADLVSLAAETPDWQRSVLADPQTSGGLLLACAPQAAAAARQCFAECGQEAAIVGAISAAAAAPAIAVAP